MRSMMTILGASALMAFSSLACDDGQSPEDGEATTDSLAFAGFALTGDDESDDGFDEDADTEPLAEEVGDDALPDDGSEEPLPDEVDPEALPEGPDRIVRTVLVVWGQPRPNPDLKETPTIWNGRVTTDTGAMKVARVIRFERGGERVAEDGTTITVPGDRLIRDDDPASVSFESVTGPHHDGLLLRLSLPRDPSALVGDFVFETEYFTKSIPLVRLVLGGEHAFRVDDLGNGLLVASHLPHRCPHGALRLTWERKNERGGVFGGRTYDARGELAGYVVGIWGEVDGKRRMKGTLLSPERTFRGTLFGTWAPFEAEGAPESGGTFRGVWRAGGAVKGVLGGLYRADEEPGEGSAAGFWRASCGDRPAAGCDDATLPPPPDASCACAPDPENDVDEACACDAPPPASACVPPEAPPAE